MRADDKFMTRKEYKNGIVTYMKITKYGRQHLNFLYSKKANKQNRRTIQTTLWNSQADIKQFVTIKPAPEFRVRTYSEQNKMVCALMKKLKMPKYAFVNELNDKNPESVIFGTYHTHALVSEYRSKSDWEHAFGKGFVSIDEVNNASKQINYILKYILKNPPPKYARLICVGYEKVKVSRVLQVKEKVVSMNIEPHRQIFTTVLGDAPL